MTIAGKSPAERRRARLRFRASHRGFKEADLIFGAFAEEFLPALDDEGLARFEELLEHPDREVMAWLDGTRAVPAAFDTQVFRQLKSICSRRNPRWQT